MFLITRNLRIINNPFIRSFQTTFPLLNESKDEEPQIVESFGGLKDQDRIFTNLYGEHVSIMTVLCCLHLIV